MDLRFFRFYAKGFLGGRVHISYGFGDIDDAIRQVHALDDRWSQEDPLAEYAFEFESVQAGDAVLLEEGFEIECGLLCDREIYRDWLDLQAMKEAA